MNPDFEKLTAEEKAEFVKKHQKGHMRIVACAGAGKTEIISSRIAEMICHRRVKPKTVVAFTFTKKSAEDLKARIRKKVDEISKKKLAEEVADLGDMFIGTIDAFCFYILKELMPQYKNFSILEEASKIAFISRFYYELGLKKLEGGRHGRYSVTTIFAEDASLARREGIEISKLKNKDFAKSLEKYMEILKRERFLDFEGVIHTLLEHLKDKAVMKQLSEHIKHLTVDEYQDVNSSQEALVERLSEICDSVCVVGDEDQCIYYWRGSEVKNIVDFEKKYKKKYDVVTVPFLINYRSTEGIVHTAREFITKNKRRENKKILHWHSSPRKHEKGDILHQHFDTEEEEFAFIKETIKQLRGSDYVEKDGKKYALSYRDIAILVRKNKDAAKVINYLESNGIKAVSEEGKSALESPEAVLATKAICYVAGFDYFKHIPFSKPIRFSVTKSMLEKEYHEVYPSKTYPETDAKKFVEILEFLRGKIKIIAEKGHNDYLPDGFTFQNIFHLILYALGADRFDFNSEKHEYKMFNLSVLSQAISDFESVYKRLRVKELEGFLHFLSTYGEGKYKETTHSDVAVLDRVRVMTVHKAKGLQFPAVFMPCNVKSGGGFPESSFIEEDEYDYSKYEGNEEDERRVWYVAMTRAQKYLFITSSQHRIGAKRKSNPHEFAGDLERKYISDKNEINLKHSKLEPRPLHYDEFYPTSFSEISAYERCPYDFKLRHEFGLNAGVPVTFGYGTNVHNVLNIIYKMFKDNPPTKAQIKKLIDENFFFRYATEAISKNMKIAGEKVIDTYVELFSEDFKNVLETEKRFEFVLGDASLSGQIDLIKKVNEKGEVIGIEIIDFKTDTDGPYERDYQTQLRLYAIACIEALGLNPKKAAVHHLDGKTKKEVEDEVDISKAKLEDTKKELSASISKIRKGHFPAKPKKSLCENCDYRYVCSKKATTLKIK